MPIGGDGGIRTLDRALQPYNGLANRRLQPLGHVSKSLTKAEAMRTYARRGSLGKSHDRRRSAGALSEQGLAGRLVGGEIDASARGVVERERAHHRWPREHDVAPAFQMREIFELLPHAPPEPHPTDAGHVGDRIGAGEILAPSQASVHHPEQTIDLVGVAVDRIGNSFWRRRAGNDWPAPPSGPSPPTCQNSHSATAIVSRAALAAEAARLLRQILQDRARLEHRNRLPAGSARIRLSPGSGCLDEIARNAGANCSPQVMSTITVR